MAMLFMYLTKLAIAMKTPCLSVWYIGALAVSSFIKIRKNEIISDNASTSVQKRWQRKGTRGHF
jgi:hypothetical protein